MTTQARVAQVATMTPEQIAAEVGTVAPTAMTENIPEEVKLKAKDILERIKNVDNRDIEARNNITNEAKSFGTGVRKNISHQSDLLNSPIKEIMGNSGADSGLSHDLLSLRSKVEEINPNKFDFSESSFRRLLSKLPGIGTKLETWWSQYQSVSTVINDILTNLEKGKNVLEKDNVTLKTDRDKLMEFTWQLQDQLQIAMLLDSELETWAESLEAAQKKYIQEDILYYLRQEVQDMQLSLGAANQAILVSDIIRRANDELIRSTDRTLNVSAKALQTAAALQVALVHQKKQMDAVKATNDMTVDLLKSTAEKAKTQGVKIVKDANDVSGMIEGLKQAFGDTIEAMDMLDAYKQEALPQMQSNVELLDGLNKQMKQQVERIDKTLEPA
ncbi:toxic anion resistance protein [Parendozoicomonas sp. Alg238-R29]|uniref:toxic anion resistance protein n=1 Tax=Parendozoicomonas sp. Alg238-R29 TaxID=2993446 RepID=UPI00248E7FF9|nr:toxic anion resistance protein [Parendozoicomonas sp. Alg238-R29]